jgi:hypothetical protein
MNQAEFLSVCFDNPIFRGLVSEAYQPYFFASPGQKLPC